jgi:hypothetical protein
MGWWAYNETNAAHLDLLRKVELRIQRLQKQIK